MKLITFLVPCYNSQDYMQKCIDSLLPAGDDCEIIIVDDGSKDNTAAIADGYAENYPDMVRVVHQSNGGHGAGINRGISLAQGLYFKVVDSDDWLDKDALLKLIQTIKSLQSKPDLIVTNFIYDKVALIETYNLKKIYLKDQFYYPVEQPDRTGFFVIWQ